MPIRPNYGNKGGGRKSAYEETLDAKWLQAILDGKIKIKDIEPTYYTVERKRTINGKQVSEKLWKHKFRSGKDALAYHILTGDITILKHVMDKLISSKKDITTDGEKLSVGGFIALPEKERNDTLL